MQSSTSNGAAYAGWCLADEQLERGLGPLEADAVCLEPLDQLAQFLRIHDAFKPVAELLGPQPRVGLPAQFGDDQPALVAHEPRIDVLVTHLDLCGGRAVDAALVRERRPADVRLVVVWLEVHDLGDVARQVGELGELAGRHDRECRLQLEVGED